MVDMCMVGTGVPCQHPHTGQTLVVLGKTIIAGPGSVIDRIDVLPIKVWFRNTHPSAN